MTHPAARHGKLLSRGMVSVMVAQFISALADNALLFVAIALLRSQQAPEWQIPLLQEAFVIAFILLAPFAGPFADAIPKGRAMLIANGVKLTGTVLMLSGLNPLLAYNLAGIGAAAYSPAKYGILRELVGPEKLVKANSLMEGSTIVAILLGAVMGGLLADWSIPGAQAVIVACYLLAAISNLLIPRLPAAHPIRRFSPMALVRDFRAVLFTMLHNRDARFSLLGTSVFWGAGSTLRFMLVAWVPAALLIVNNTTPAALSGVVAIGIAFGAAAAARLVTLESVNRSLPAGILIGLLIMVFAHVASMPMAVTVLMLIGACGGFYVVPLNALLQERGHETVGAGHAIAVQNFFENTSMLLMVGFYISMAKSGIPVVAGMTGFGALVVIGIALLGWWRTGRRLE
jgi:LPLT family lysophospholipid transporter-like MFS transporter